MLKHFKTVDVIDKFSDIWEKSQTNRLTDDEEFLLVHTEVALGESIIQDFGKETGYRLALVLLGITS